MTLDIPQIIPEGRCLKCDICCRFPEVDSPMRPYFTAAEIETAVARGVPAGQFPDRSGGRVSLLPHPAGDGYVCPAFDVATNRCTIYHDRPLDCRLYPFVVVRPPEGTQPLLGWDRLCPYLREESDPMLPLKTAPVIAQQLSAGEAPPLSNDPGFAGPFQESAWMLEPLPIDLVEGRPTSPPAVLPPGLPGIRLSSIGDDPDEVERVRRFLIDAVEAPLSVRHPAALLMWRPLMRLFWAELEGGTAMLACQAETWFAPAPPRPREGQSLPAVCRQLLTLLDRLNANPAASRIERIGASQHRVLSEAGLVCRPSGEEYLYDRSALAQLRGDQYKSQRWSCNQAERRFRPQYAPYQSGELTACLRLYAVWRRLKERREPADDYADALRADSFYAHWQALAHVEVWGLVARVVRIDGVIRAYTIGAPLDDRTLLILHEIADPACSGLGPWLFREVCREFTAYPDINAMDDSELSSLRETKLRYRPARTVPMYQAVLDRQ